MTIAGKVIIFFFLPLFGGGGPLLIALLIRISRNTRQMADDWKGEPARPGVAARPGVMQRLFTIEQQLAVVHHEVQPNGGSSIKDQINRLDPHYTQDG